MGFLSSLHFISSFFYNQLLVTLPVPTKSFEGQTIVVTGSNTGLGLEAARHISRLNAKLLILAVRNTSKGEAAKASILASTHRPESSIQVWELDLHSFESIKRFADRAKGLERLDAVLENAGIVTKYFTLVEGYENTIMTNVISTFLLALLVLPKLRETAELVGRDTHLAVVASDLHFMARFVEGSEGDIFGALNKRENFKASMERYSTSKLLEVFSIRVLGDLETSRISSSKDSSTNSSCGPRPQVIINCMTPGACMSDFFRENPPGLMKSIGDFFSGMIARTAEQGSRALVAGLEADRESQGAYMDCCVVAKPSPFVLGEEGRKMQKRVWEQLLVCLEGIQPGISKGL